MGYESKLYFVRTYDSTPKLSYDEKIFAEKILEIRLGKIGGMPKCFKKPTNYFVYKDDGETPILKDSYGEPLYECDLNELRNWLLEEMENEPYYVFNLLKSVIEGFGTVQFSPYGEWIDVRPKWATIRVLHCGY